MKPTKLKEFVKAQLAQGLTQVALAKKLGVSPGAIYKWLNTDTVPDIATLKKIADNSGLKLLDLLGDDNSRKSELLSLTDDETRLLASYRKLREAAPHVAGTLHNYLSGLLAAVQRESIAKTRQE